MQHFSIEDEVVSLVSELAKPRQFESFSDALKRLLLEVKRSHLDDGNFQRPEPRNPAKINGSVLDDRVDGVAARDHSIDRGDVLNDSIQSEIRSSGTGFDESRRSTVIADRIRAPSPDPRLWISRVPELVNLSGMTTWRAICEHLQIEVGGDSARRRLQEWVQANRRSWPPVPNA